MPRVVADPSTHNSKPYARHPSTSLPGEDVEYVCPYDCGFSCDNMKKANIHMKQHNPLKCADCSGVWYDEGGLKRHRARDHGPKSSSPRKRRARSPRPPSSSYGPSASTMSVNGQGCFRVQLTNPVEVAPTTVAPQPDYKAFHFSEFHLSELPNAPSAPAPSPLSKDTRLLSFLASTYSFDIVPQHFRENSHPLSSAFWNSVHAKMHAPAYQCTTAEPNQALGGLSQDALLFPVWIPASPIDLSAAIEYSKLVARAINLFTSPANSPSPAPAPSQSPRTPSPMSFESTPVSTPGAYELPAFVPITAEDIMLPQSELPDVDEMMAYVEQHCREALYSGKTGVESMSCMPSMPPPFGEYPRELSSPVPAGASVNLDLFSFAAPPHADAFAPVYQKDIFRY